MPSQAKPRFWRDWFCACAFVKYPAVRIKWEQFRNDTQHTDLPHYLGNENASSCQFRLPVFKRRFRNQVFQGLNTRFTCALKDSPRVSFFTARNKKSRGARSGHGGTHSLARSSGAVASRTPFSDFLKHRWQIVSLHDSELMVRRSLNANAAIGPGQWEQNKKQKRGSPVFRSAPRSHGFTCDVPMVVDFSLKLVVVEIHASSRVKTQ